MKRAFFCGLLLCSFLSLRAQTLSGQLLDEANRPVSFANVVLLSLPDSAFVSGTITDDDGRFSISGDGRLLRISSVGYTTVYHTCTTPSVGTIVMTGDTQLLGEVVVKGTRPAYKLTADGLQTQVQGTVLSRMGTADDVLKHIPGVQKKNNAYEVFGKGTPIIYVNGRLLRDLSELDQLKSEDIRNVQLITHPGARYDASVKAVIRITTRPVKGEGFGFDVRSVYKQWEDAGFVEQLNWNYRKNKLDVFGTIFYAHSKSRATNYLTQDVRVDTLWHQDNYQSDRSKDQSFTHIVGANYAFDADNSIGVRYTLKANPDGTYHTLFNSDVYADGMHYDYLANDISGTGFYDPSHLVNLYYKGKAGETGIDFNADYLFDKYGYRMTQREASTNQEDRLVTSTNNLRNRLFAAKLILDHSLWGGNLSAGAEYSHTERKDDYVNPEGYVPTTFSRLVEQNVSPFVEYSRDTPIGQFTVGGRYEHVDFDYYEDGEYVAGQSRNFGNFFPNASWSAAPGDVQLQLGYTAKTRRPSYMQLRNNVTYANRFTLQTGNPLLKHEVVHNVSLSAAWKFLQVSLDYNDRRDAIIFWGEQTEANPAVTLISFKNLHSLKSVSAFLSLAPRFGIWSPELSLGVQKQWLDLQTADGVRKMNKPMVTGAFNNSFSFPHGWMASVEMSYQGKGDRENYSETRNLFSADAGLTKFFLDDKLSVKLAGTDLFHGLKSGNRMYFNRTSSYQWSSYDSRKITLTLRYKFNTTRSKYKGTGAGNDEKNRL